MDSVNPSEFSNEEVDIATLPRYEEVSWIPLAPRYLLKLQIGTVISHLFVTAAWGLFWFFSPFREEYFWIFGGLLLCSFFWSLFRNFQLARRNGYVIRERDLLYRRGFVSEKITVIPLNRIQHVSVERSALDKVLRLSTLKIFTAGGSGSDIRIPAILPGTAVSIKEEISSRISRHV